MNTYFANSKLLWTPDHPQRASSEELRRRINRKYGLNLSNYYDLYKYSIEDYTFWLDLWDFLEIISSVPPSRILKKGTIEEVPIWFPNARLNFAENLLYQADEAIAVTSTRETGEIVHYTYKELRELVREMAAALRVNGLKIGDRVAGIFTNSIECIVVGLAVASIGGIFSSTAPDMGTKGILDRFIQIRPKFVFVETEVFYAGKVVCLLPKITEIVGEMKDESLEKVILLPSRVSKNQSKLVDVPHSVTLSEFLKSGDSAELTFEQLPFSQPLFILYTSGTSGKPKCIVHSAGGALMQIKKVLKIGYDTSRDDVYLQYTSTGWVTWVYLLTGLSFGCRIVIYDGSPLYPNPRDFLKLVSDTGVTILGTSPKFLSEIQSHRIDPLEVAPFSRLRTIISAGSMLIPALAEWTFRAFGSRIQLASSLGSTDVCTSLISACASLPIYAGELQCKALGMKVEVFDPEGNNIEDTGRPGELVCTRPHPSLPIGFWGDSDGERFKKTYFSMYPGVWRQGDFIVMNPVTKGCIILGRSDGVLNPGGIRFGSGEIYSVMEQFSDSVLDSLCVGQRRARDKDERVFLFVKMRRGICLSGDLERKIRHGIKTALSARHVPAYIFEVEDIPYTTNGKRVEIAVKQIISGHNIEPSGTVVNAESLQQYYKYTVYGDRTSRL